MVLLHNSYKSLSFTVEWFLVGFSVSYFMYIHIQPVPARDDMLTNRKHICQMHCLKIQGVDVKSSKWEMSGCHPGLFFPDPTSVCSCKGVYSE